MIGEKITVNGNNGEVIEQSGIYILVRFDFGQFVLNKQKIEREKNK